MSKVLILGASGLLGQSVKSEFEKMEGYEVLSPSSKSLNLLEFKNVSAYFNEYNPEFVINCTGFNAVDEAETEDGFVKAKALNFNLLKNLVDICQANELTLMSFSSDYVFDGKSSEPYDEDASPAPLSKYAETKVMGENYLRENLDKFYLVRLSWLFGPGKVNFADKILARGRAGEPLRVVTDEVGKPTYAPDVAAEIPLMIESEDYGVYHLVNEGIVSWHRFAEEVLEIAGIDAKIEKIQASDLNLPAKRPKYTPLENTKWQKLRPHTEALKDYLKTNE